MLRRYVELSCEVDVLPWRPRLYTKSDYQSILVYCPLSLLLMRRTSLRPPCTPLLSLTCMTLVPRRTRPSRMFCPTNSQICGSELEGGTGKHLKKFSNLWVCIKVVLDLETDVISKVPSDDIRNWEDYKEYLKPHIGISVSRLYESPVVSWTLITWTKYT